MTPAKMALTMAVAATGKPYPAAFARPYAPNAEIRDQVEKNVRGDSCGEDQIEIPKRR